MLLAIDVMGFENDISHAVNACRKFIKKHGDVKFILVGKKNEIEKRIKKNEFEIYDSPDVVKMGENPILTLRSTTTSMYNAVNLVADNQADGVLSAGSTASYVMLTYSLIKLLPGIDKLAFMTSIPTVNKKTPLFLLDSGANLVCSGKDLYQFALIASIYCKKILHISSPVIKVINIGTEESKGYEYHKNASELLKKNKTLNFNGYIEPKEMVFDDLNIAVCDGYTGNIVLKSLESGGKLMSNLLKK
jgi:glycerol-3-phosphate acyltransferase PlsX